MSTSAPLGHRTPRGRGEQHAAESARLSRDVTWSWGLLAFTLPAALVAVVAVAILERLAGTHLVWGGGLVYVAVMAPLAASIVIGVRGWRREHQMLALRAALLSALMLVAGTVLVLLS